MGTIDILAERTERRNVASPFDMEHPPCMRVDQRKWWDRGDSARGDDERQCAVRVVDATILDRDGRVLTYAEIKDALAYFFLEDLEEMTDNERDDALEAAVQGYVNGVPGGYGQPNWL